MTDPAHVVALVLVGLGIAVIALSAVGVLVARGALAKLHYTGPVTTIGSALVVAGIVVERGVDVIGLSALVVGAVLGISSPVLTHATARAANRRHSRIGSPR